MMYRRGWRTIAADLGVDELIAHFCLGHIPSGISRGYVHKMIISGGSAMRTAQRKVSKRIIEHSAPIPPGNAIVTLLGQA